MGEMNGLDLSDVSILVSVKIDSPQRHRNLGFLLDYYECFFSGYQIIVVEQDESTKIADLVSRNPNVEHHLIRSRDVHWKTRNHNHGARLSNRDLLLMADCDVFPHPQAVIEGCERVRNGCEFVQLFNGVLVGLDDEFVRRGLRFPEVLDTLAYFPRDFSLRPEPFGHCDMAPLYGNHKYLATGGATLCRRRSFFLTGGWNENFVSFGYEDREFYERVEKLGRRVVRMEAYNAYHMAHPRLDDSVYNNYYRSNEAEYQRVCAMDADALLEYANKGFRSIRFGHDRTYTLESTAERWGWTASCFLTQNLRDVTIVIVASAARLPYSQSDLRRMTDYLEGGFNGYDVLIFELKGGDYKYIHNSKHVRYVRDDSGFDPDSDAAVQRALHHARRPYVQLVRLWRPQDIGRFFSVLERLRAGEHPGAALSTAGAAVSRASIRPKRAFEY